MIPAEATAAICAEPEDDLPRLQVADWLDEHGEAERAALIRLQCGPDRGYAWSGELRYYRHDVFDLLGSHGKGERFLPGWPLVWNFGVPDQSYVVGWNWSRGFVDYIALTAADWLSHADALAWRPGETVECVEPDGELKTSSHLGCDRCKGTGRVPRPCPPTAQPIERVVLKTWPGLVSRGASSSGRPTLDNLELVGRDIFGGGGPAYPEAYRKNVLALLSIRWPRIEFALPTPARA